VRFGKTAVRPDAIRIFVKLIRVGAFHRFSLGIGVNGFPADHRGMLGLSVVVVKALWSQRCYSG
jgi:flagellar biosynthesis protein FliR